MRIRMPLSILPPCKATLNKKMLARSDVIQNSSNLISDLIILMRHFLASIVQPSLIWLRFFCRRIIFHVSWWSPRHFVHMLLHSQCAFLIAASHLWPSLSLTCPLFLRKVRNRSTHLCALWYRCTRAIKSTHIVQYIASCLLTCNEKQQHCGHHFHETTKIDENVI